MGPSKDGSNREGIKNPMMKLVLRIRGIRYVRIGRIA